MGQIASRLKEPLHAAGSVAEIITGSRKRKRNDNDHVNHEETQTDIHTPKKKRLLTTTQYIYQTLFKDEKNADISVMALGKVWHLHKVYLCQSPYFNSMFNGSWRETFQDFISIEIMDSKITLDSLQAVFGSLYSDEIEIDPSSVIPVLATATLFQLERIIDKCTEVMIETTNAETAVLYYETACQYGNNLVKQTTFEWLLLNLLSLYNKQIKHLKLISTELLTALVSSPNLYVMQTEFSLYTLLRTWLYTRIFPNFEPDENKPEDLQIPQNFFAKRKDSCPFLLTEDGLTYIEPFNALRLEYLICHHMDMKLVFGDNIIPKNWLIHHVQNHWNTILKIDHSHEPGPQNEEEAVFNKYSMRCGRTLMEPGYQKWRWTGFNFGLDLILISDQKVLSIRRHHRAEHERLLSVQTKRQFMVKVSVSSINSQRQRTFCQQTEIKSLSLEKNEEVQLLTMDPKLVHPLLISVNLLVHHPDKMSDQEKFGSLRENSSLSIPISEISGDVFGKDLINQEQQTE